MQRTGRKGHAQFRMIVQDSRFSPASGRVVAYLGSYDPHAKTVTLDKQKVQAYLDNGAQPSDRAATLLKDEGVKLPGWYSAAAPKSRSIRHQDKLRRNRLAEEPAAEASEAPAETPESAATEAAAEETSTETPATEVEESTDTAGDASNQKDAETAAAEAPAEPDDTEAAT